MRRLPIYILIDCSASMAGEPIEAVRAGLQSLASDLREDPAALEMARLSVIVFGDTAEQVCPLTAPAAFQEPDLEAGGGTALGQALRELLTCADRELNKSTAGSRGDFKPIVFLVTGGCPTDDWERPAEQLKSRRWNVFACAVGPGGDKSVLGRITNSVITLVDRHPATLAAFFRWMSCSLRTASSCRSAASTSDGAVKLPPLPPEIKPAPAGSDRRGPVVRFGDVGLPPRPSEVKAASTEDFSSPSSRESPAEKAPDDDTEVGMPADSSWELDADEMADDGIVDMPVEEAALDNGGEVVADEALERAGLPEGGKLDENVQFTVFRPEAVQPQIWYPLLAFAHLTLKRADAPDSEPDPIEEMERQAVQALGERKDEYASVTQDSASAIPRAGDLTFLTDFPDLEFNPPSRSFRWLESVHREEFRFRAPLRVQGTTVRGRVTVLLGVTIVADIPLAIRVEAHVDSAEARRRTKPATARPYRKIFASYSRKDTAIVDQFEKFARTMGDDFLRDISHLRAGEIWSERLERMISEADIFQLFWSHNSMYSAFVEREWRYALSMNRREFVRPVYWEQPLPADPGRGLPPGALQRLHFQLFPSGPATIAAVSIPQVDRDQSPDMAASPGPALDYTPAASSPAKTSPAGSRGSIFDAHGPGRLPRHYGVSPRRWDASRPCPPPACASPRRSPPARVNVRRRAAHAVGALAARVFAPVVALSKMVLRIVVRAISWVSRLFV